MGEWERSHSIYNGADGCVQELSIWVIRQSTYRTLQAPSLYGKTVEIGSRSTHADPGAFDSSHMRENFGRILTAFAGTLKEPLEEGLVTRVRL